MIILVIISFLIDLISKIIVSNLLDVNEVKALATLPSKEEIYAQVMRETFGTWPGLWGMQQTEDYEAAKVTIFGNETAKYAKLIEKTDAYHELVASDINGILQTIKDNEVKTVNIAKYGYQIAPVIESRNEIGDQFVTLKLASFGATTSTVFETLSDEYIEQRKKEKEQIQTNLNPILSPTLEEPSDERPVPPPPFPPEEIPLPTTKGVFGGKK